MTNPTHPRLIATLFAAATMITAASAMAADNTAAASADFKVATTSNSVIRAGVSAFKKGDYEKSVTFTRAALKSSLSDRRAAIAQSNLCAAYGKLGEMDLAQEACAIALELRPGYAPAEQNKAALTIRFAQN